ncbi:MAG: ATP-dependent Clp protease adapter ClpS [bacterium]|nr:ATP-dependent Clp protease adapter ClpS [bacterium]
MEPNDIDSTDSNMDIATKTKAKTRFKKPKMYKVLIFNDDYTSMDFVVDILVSVFSKAAAEATSIMLDVHRRGSGVCGVYTYDIAMTKVNRVHILARESEFPLRCGIEEI